MDSLLIPFYLCLSLFFLNRSPLSENVQSCTPPSIGTFRRSLHDHLLQYEMQDLLSKFLGAESHLKRIKSDSIFT